LKINYPKPYKKQIVYLERKNNEIHPTAVINWEKIEIGKVM